MKHTKHQPPAIPRLKILKEIAEHLCNTMQWASNGNLCGYTHCAKYMTKAEALIELLEVADCGSVGGFDEGQQENDSPSHTIFARFEWLVNKYHKTKDIKVPHGPRYAELQAFFIPHAQP